MTRAAGGARADVTGDLVVAGRPDRAASLAVVAAWLVAWSTSIHAVFTAIGIATLIIAVLLLLVALWAGGASGTPSRRLLLLAAPTGILGVVIAPPLINIVRTANGLLVPGIVVGCLALLVLYAVLRPTTVPVRVAAIGVLVTVAIGYGMIIAGSRPLIDVWIILQQTAQGLLDGRNPYAMMFSGVPAGQMSWCFNYWPVTFVSTAPAQWLVGDVRYAEAGYLLATSALLAWQVRRDANDREQGPQAGGGQPDRARLALALLVALLPGSLLIVQQAWTEPILLAGLVSGAVLLRRDHPNWAILPLGLALATKQHLVLVLPLLLFWPRFGWRRVLGVGAVAAAGSLPWALADWSRFRLCTVDFFLNEQNPSGSLSLWRVLPEPLRMPLLVLGFLGAVVVVLLRCPRTPGGFLIGAGAVLSAFSLFNKQTFVNQWWLAAALVLAGLALRAEVTGPRRPVGSVA